MSIAKRNSEAAKAWAEKRRESQERALVRHQERTSASSSSSTPSPSTMSRQPVYREAAKPPRNSASTSHEVNATYMDDFRENMANIYSALEGPSSSISDSKVGSNRAASSTGRGASLDQGRRTSRHEEKAVVSDRIRRRDHPGGRGGCFRSTPGGALLGDERKKDTDGGVASGWRRGPVDPAGHLVDLSDRNILCSSVSGDEAVFGCADHALYCVDLSRGVKTRQLYGSRSKPDAGHKEWVSAVAHTAHGDIVSAGMDGKLCLWPRGGGSSGEVQAHAGSISALKADAEGRVATSGYGGAVRVWDCRGGGRGASAPRLCAELSDRTLPSPCMDFAWNGCRLMTGHRDGRVGVYDLQTGALLGGAGGGGGGGAVGGGEPAHRGHVTAVNASASDNSGGWSGCFATGGQDGFVRIWDHRVGESGGGASRGGGGGSRSAAVMEAPAHRGTRGIGAVGGVVEAGGGGNRLASFGADRRVCILEVRGGRGGGGGGGSNRSRSSSEGLPSCLAIEHVFEDHRDFIYCADFLPDATGWGGAGGGGGGGEGVLVTGGGDGMLLVHDLGSMRLLYGLGCCSAGAVRCVVTGGRRLTVGGDDGNAMLYDFDGERSGK